MIPRTVSLALSTAAVGVGTAAYARYVEPRWLERTHTRISIAGLAAPLDGLRIALLTDLHVSDRRSLGLARRACQLALDASPDLVALTGDLVSENTGGWLPTTIEMLGEALEAPLGVWSVPGNHDHLAGIERYARAIDRTRGVRGLAGRAVRLEVGGAVLRVAGTDTASGHPHPTEALTDEASADAPPADCTIVLTHNPDLADDACRALGHADLVLSGHTHGGQVRLPFVGALKNSAEHEDVYEAGLVRRPWTQVYVSRGVGTVRHRVRFLCRPEVAILELRRAD